MNAEPQDVQTWLDHISSYEKEFKKWEGRSEKILKRYRDENRKNISESKFNILWSNVQTLTAATFAKLPKPDVSRRFRDQDPVGRVAALILERALEYEIQKYTNYSSALKSSIADRFLGGRGAAWVRYEPHFKAQQDQMPMDGDQITEDVDQPQEELDYECAPCDYIHWRDFGHTIARTWEEVTAVWRRVYLTRAQCVERFGDLGKTIPLDSKPEDAKYKQMSGDGDSKSRAMVYEIWDKTTKQAIWLSKSMKQILDAKDDPLGLEGFYPCPKPLFATLTNDSLIPIPDFTMYQDQANVLDIISNRIDELVKVLKVAGGYDASIPELARIFTESVSGTLIPIKNWQAFAEKNGLQGAISCIDLTPISNALRELYTAFEQVKSQIYEITGISDIIRGQTQASETATAQQLKGQYASLRLKTYQEEVAIYSTELLQIKAQIICGHFTPQTILIIGAADQLPQWDQQFIQPALELLIGKERMMNPEAPQGPNPMRSFRIEVSSDTLIYLDEESEKQSRVEFITAASQFMQQFAQIAPVAPQIVPLALELFKFGSQAFKVGKTIEGKIDETAQQLIQQMSQPKSDPRAEAHKAKAESDMRLTQSKERIEGIKAKAEETKAQADVITSNLALQAKVQAMNPFNDVPNV